MRTTTRTYLSSSLIFHAVKNNKEGDENTASVYELDNRVLQAIHKTAENAGRNMMERCKLCKCLKLHDMELSNLYCKSAVPSKLEFVNIAIELKNICAVGGIRGIWEAKDKHWCRLTFDHIVPISKGGSFKADNIQIMLLSLNCLKGTHANTELTRFLSVFRKKN
ncbi:hypothetical protein EDC94DRAFT_627199 [Helicostylum pulchrum]|nr:hypothetical protein EDC94DRAFT_627199 [Helicostylum pulchrum]